MSEKNWNQKKSASLSWRQVKKFKYSKQKLKSLYDSTECEESKRRIKIVYNLKLWEKTLDLIKCDDLKLKSMQNRKFRFNFSHLFY